MSNHDLVIVAAQRTPIGGFQGVLAALSGPQLGSAAIAAAVKAAGIKPSDVQEVLMGCVLPAGVGQAPARQASVNAGIPIATPATTVSKVCGSAMKAIMIACDQVRVGDLDIAVAGGMESMTNAPYVLPKARSGYRLGHGEILDHMFFDGLQNSWDKQLMGCFADATARKYSFSREQQDAFAAESVRRALEAVQSGAFKDEVAPVTVKGRKGDQVVDRDETPFNCSIDKIATLKPAFGKDGTVTAASSSSIADGAAAVVVTTPAVAQARGLKPLARVLAYTSHAHEPEWFTTAPVGAMRKLLEKLDWKAGDVDLYEVNEAFAAVTMAAVHDLSLDPARVNVNGGACALGHPIGATGARIVTTLVHALRRRQLKRGIASLCIGGGEATAMAIEVA
jgi:acetyl-CoA C-acetyltransferase